MRSMFRPFASDGFHRVPKVAINRNFGLDTIIITKKNKIVARRRTVGFRATPQRNTGSTASPRHTPPVPQLIPLKSALRMPSRPPFNVRGRKSMFPRINPAPSASGSPTIAKGTTTQMILNRVLSSPSTPASVQNNVGTTSSPIASTSSAIVNSHGTVPTSFVTMQSPVRDTEMGRLTYSDTDSD